LQVLLQIENYIVQNGPKSKVDDDWVWEIANLIRWLSQTFKEKFKIEKFLFGEIFTAYHSNSPEFILSLMEELGYDKDDNNGDDKDSNSGFDSTSESSSALASPLATPHKSPFKNSSQATNSVLKANASVSSQHTIATSICNNLTNHSYLREDSSSNCSYTFVGGITSLFEDYSQTNFSSQLNATCSNNNNNNNSLFNDSNENDNDNNLTLANDNTDILLNELNKKKTVNRFTDYSSNMRSIVVQRKRVRIILAFLVSVFYLVKFFLI
jgi:hypothetical protein